MSLDIWGVIICSEMGLVCCARAVRSQSSHLLAIKCPKVSPRGPFFFGYSRGAPWWLWACLGMGTAAPPRAGSASAVEEQKKQNGDFDRLVLHTDSAIANAGGPVTSSGSSLSTSAARSSSRCLYMEHKRSQKSRQVSYIQKAGSCWPRSPAAGFGRISLVLRPSPGNGFRSFWQVFWSKQDNSRCFQRISSIL
jgi:hypothetical protein